MAIDTGATHLVVAWIYGVAGIVGFIAQIIVGIQGRLVPLYAYYRAMHALGSKPPARGANQLPSPRFARPIFLCWTAGVPLLAWGLAGAQPVAIRIGGILLLAGVGIGAAYLRHLMRTARD